MLIVCEFPVLPTVSKEKLPVNFVVDIADEKLLPTDSIVKLPVPVMPDVAAKYVVGSSFYKVTLRLAILIIVNVF